MSDKEAFDPVKAFLSAPAPEAPAEVAEVQDEAVESDTEMELPTEEQSRQSDRSKVIADQTDKALQKLQQLTATYEREMRKFAEKPTERQAERVEKAKSKLDAIIESGADVDPYKGIVDVADELRVDRGRQEALLQEFEAHRRATEERQAQLEAQNARLQFALEHPELKGRYQEFAQKAHEAVEEIFGESTYQLDPTVYLPLANREFARLVKEASGNVAADQKPAKASDSARTPKAATVLKTKSGNSVKPPESREATYAKLLKGLVSQG